MTRMLPGWPSAWKRPSYSIMRPYASETAFRMRFTPMRFYVLQKPNHKSRFKSNFGL